MSKASLPRGDGGEVVVSEIEPPSRHYLISGSCKPQSGQPHTFVSRAELKSNPVKSDQYLELSLYLA